MAQQHNLHTPKKIKRIRLAAYALRYQLNIPPPPSLHVPTAPSYMYQPPPATCTKGSPLHVPTAPSYMYRSSPAPCRDRVKPPLVRVGAGDARPAPWRRRHAAPAQAHRRCQ
eukprot:6203937-Pleurochrysis_carterae.AAC.1